MSKYRIGVMNVEAITFDELVAYGLQNAGAHIHNGMPWSFEYKGRRITHESNDGVFIETPKYIKLLKIKKQLLDCVEEMQQLQLQYGYEDEIMSVGSWLLWGLAIIAFIAICILV